MRLKSSPPCHLTRGPGDSEREGLPAGGALQCQRGLHTGQVFISLCQELGYSPQVELADCTELAGQCKHMYWFRNNHKAGMLCPQFRPARKIGAKGEGVAASLSTASHQKQVHSPRCWASSR